MSSHTRIMTDSLYNYYQNAFLRESEVLAELRSETALLPGAIMQISPEQGQFMQLLIRILRAKRILELGTYTGYSALAMALEVPENGELVTCDLKGAWLDVAERYWQKAGVNHKITLKTGPAVNTLKDLIAAGQEDSFDFIFIDADKANSLIYYEQSLTLVRSGGMIAVDNVFWRGRVADPTDTDKDTLAFRALNERLKNDPRIFLSCLPIGDGLALAQKI